MAKQRKRIGARVTIAPRGKKGLWTAEFSYRGQHCRRSLKTSNQRTALARARGLDEQLDNGTYQPSSITNNLAAEALTIGDIIHEFVRGKKNDGLRQKSIVDYTSKLTLFQQFCTIEKADRLDQVDLRLVDRYRETRRKEKKSEKTIHHDCVLLKQFFTWCVRRKLMLENPLAEEVLRKPKNKVQRVLTLDQIHDVLHAAQGELHDCVATLAMTGMRSGDLKRLRHEDVDFSGGWIHVRSRPGAETKTGNSWKVPLARRLGAILKARPRKSTGYFFTAPPSPAYPDGKHCLNQNRLNDEFRGLLEKLGLPVGRKEGFTIHSLRHFMKTHCVNAGVPRHIVDEWQGHAWSRTAADRYLHISDEVSQDWMRKVAF